MSPLQRDNFLNPSSSNDSSAPPAPPAHLTLSMQQRTQRPISLHMNPASQQSSNRPPYDMQQLHPPPRNPFNDSNLALSQTSTRNSAASIPADIEHSSRGFGGGLIAGGAASEAIGRPRDGSVPSLGPADRNSIHSGYSGYSGLEGPISDPLARNPVFQTNPYPTNTSYMGPDSAGPSNLSQHTGPLPGYPSPVQDGPYKRYSSAWDSRIDQADFNPDDIADDGDDGLNREAPSRSRSVLGFGRSRSGGLAAGAPAGAAPGGVVNAIRNVSGSDPSGEYGPVPASDRNGVYEKSQDRAQEEKARKRKRLIFLILGVVTLVAIIGGAVAGGILGSRKNSGSGSGSSPSSASQTPSSNLDLNSPQIQALMKNDNLHRVFPGFDYTPMNAQYPDCLNAPPSQDNVTMDIAILSQLTKTIRLYGTDCNQTDMILDALDRLKITDMKLWLGVWLDNNQTTNDRGMSAMWDILKRKGQDPFAGVIVGNEVLYRKDMTEQELSDLIQGVRQNFTSQKIDLPLAVADLGDNWNSALVQDVDVVMSNVHPFFGGVEASAAAEWTWNFWETHDVVLTQGTSKKNIISETGWPSAGGNDCAPNNCTSDTEGAVAGIDEMNTFMDSFVCQSLANGTDYFWSVSTFLTHR